MEADNTESDIDNALLKRFEDLAEIMPSDGVAIESSHTESVKSILMLHFPSFHDDILLTRNKFNLTQDYASNYVNGDGSSVKGRFCIARYCVDPNVRYAAYFYSFTTDHEALIFLSLPFKDVTSFDTIYTKGLLNPDMLQIVMANNISVKKGYNC